VIPKFLQQVGSAADALEVVAWLVLAVAAIAITVAIYNTMNERRREIAIMRSLGARRYQILTIIVGEAALLSLFGAVLGVLTCHLCALLLRGTVEDLTGVYLDWAAFAVRELYLVAAVTGLGAVAGLLPAAKGSLTQVADNLAPSY
jgi:putative ABC transport system permease protein